MRATVAFIQCPVTRIGYPGSATRRARRLWRRVLDFRGRPQLRRGRPFFLGPFLL